MASRNEPETAGAPDWTFVSRSPEETARLAFDLAIKLRGGEVILLRGELGSGKTCFAGGLGEGLEIAEPVISPTYIILRSYLGGRGLTLHHLDFYRLERAEDLDTLGVEELTGEDNVVLVEWPERCPGAFPNPSLELKFNITGDEERRIEAWGLRLEA